MDDVELDGSGQDEALPGPAADDRPTAGLAETSPGPQTAAPLALYRRYRPDTFADVIGQDHVTEPLQRALTNNRVNHAYLFSGPRGCGKTTSARILARALNCERGPSPEPCGHCQSCVDLARGGPGSIDVIEIDAASHGGVDDARDLRERAFFAPVHSRYKIYIVDEAHMVTTAGFNALLKLVEEPPPHVKFIFATTEPDKVIGTIRSRTHHYPFRLVPPKILGAYLARLCEAEGIAVEPAVLPLVVRAGGGSVRDSLSVLDQLLGGAGPDGVGYAQAVGLLGYTPDSLLDEVLDAFAAGDGAGVFGAVDKVIEVGQDPRRFAEDLLRRLRDLVVVAAVPDALTSGLVAVADDQGERLSAQAAALGQGELTRAAEVIADGLTQMRGTTAPRLYLELMCSRVLLPGADVAERGVHARLDRLERRVGMVSGEATPAPSRDEPSRSEQPSVSRTAPPVVTTPGPASPEASDGAAREATPAGRAEPAEPTSSERSAAEPASPAGTPGPSSEVAPPSAPEDAGPPGREPVEEDSAVRPSTDPERPAPPAASPEPERGASTAAGLSTADVRRLWPEVLEEVKLRRRFTWILLSQNAQVTGAHDGVLSLGLSNPGARDSFARGGSEDVLREAIVHVLGVDLRVEAIVDPTTEPGRGSEAGRGAAPITRQPDPWAGTPTPPASASPNDGAQSPPSPSMPGAASAEAREQIRSTRLYVVRDDAPPEEADHGIDRDDRSLDENVDHNELLTKHLGAELIGEEPKDQG